MILPIVMSANYTFVTTQYTDHGGALNLIASGASHVWNGMTTVGIWDQTASQVRALPLSQSATTAASQLANKAVIVQQSTANPTGGDGTVTVTVLYIVVPVS